MSFAAIRAGAYSAMTVAQIRMQVAAANIANADTDGYTVKRAEQVANNFGVSIADISSAVDKYLLEDIVRATTELGAATTTNDYAQSLQALYGSTTGDGENGTSLAQSIANFESVLVELAATPDSQTLKSKMIDALDALTSKLKETSAGIQNLQAQVDGQIGDGVDIVNNALETVASLNAQILNAEARGLSTGDLEDQRNTALQTVAEQMDVTSFINSDGAMRISATGSGKILVGSSAHLLDYSGTGTISIDGTDITDKIHSGVIGALVTTREETLVAAQEELDALSGGLIDRINTAYSTLTSTPPPSSLNGTTSVAAGDALGATGTFRIVVTEADGTAVSVSDLDMANYATMGDFVAAVDAITGISASIDADGKVNISSDNAAYGIAISETDVHVDPNGSGLAAYLGFNNLLTGTNARNIAVRADLLSDPSQLTMSAVSSVAGLTAGDNALTTDALPLTLKEALSEGYAFAAAGNLPAGTKSFADYTTNMITGIVSGATRAQATHDTRDTALSQLSDAMASKTGVNLDEETAQLAELNQYYAVAAQVLATLNTMFDALLTTARSA